MQARALGYRLDYFPTGYVIAPIANGWNMIPFSRLADIETYFQNETARIVAQDMQRIRTGKFLTVQS